MTRPILTVSLLADVPDARRADLARDLLRDLRRSGFGAVSAPTPPSQPNERSGLALLADIAVTALTHGTAIIFADCLKTYLMRERKLRFVLKTADGQEIVVDPEAVKTEQTLAFLRAAEHDS